MSCSQEPLIYHLEHQYWGCTWIPHYGTLGLFLLVGSTWIFNSSFSCDGYLVLGPPGFIFLPVSFHFVFIHVYTSIYIVWFSLLSVLRRFIPPVFFFQMLRRQLVAPLVANSLRSFVVTSDYASHKPPNKQDEMLHCEGEELFVVLFSSNIDPYLSYNF